MNHPIYDPIFYRLEWEAVESPIPFHGIGNPFFTREEAEKDAREQGFEWIEVRTRELSADDEDHFGEVADYSYVKVRPLRTEKPVAIPEAETVAA